MDVKGDCKCRHESPRRHTIMLSCQYERDHYGVRQFFCYSISNFRPGLCLYVLCVWRRKSGRQAERKGNDFSWLHWKAHRRTMGKSGSRNEIEMEVAILSLATRSPQQMEKPTANDIPQWLFTQYSCRPTERTSGRRGCLADWLELIDSAFSRPMMQSFVIGLLLYFLH